MKAILLFIGFTAASVQLGYSQDAGSADALNEKYGFRDAHFEAPFTSFKGMSLAVPGKLTKAYVRPTDSKKIGGAEVSKILYYFYKGKLASIAIRTTGIKNSRALYDALVAQYGDAEQPNEYMRKFFWDATRVSMVYDENSITNDALVVMSSKPMGWQEKEDNEQAAKKAGADL